MQQFALLSALFAAGVISKPVHEQHGQFHKRQDVVNVQTEFAYETAFVTVTAGQQQSSAAPATSAAPAVLTTVIPHAASSAAPAPATTPSSTFVPSSAASSASSTADALGPVASSGNTFLDAHNTFRALHGAQLMSWNQSLADTAKSYGCANGDKQAGSNWAGGTTMSEFQAVKMWYDEESAYASATSDYTQDPPSGYSGPETGHFSQLIWDASTSVGCAMINSCGEYSNQVTCLYSPAGNVAVQGQDSYVKNVFAPKVAGH